ncbi:MAG: putative nucleic acid-binding protein, contains PIN domain protein [halophilic archaeon J07HX64]|nr:MAG: putative nucleic acid-binding protein, contains PIN domain protein [halophilic archaeon J07HX64]
MTFLDSSVIIDYLEGIEPVVAFVDEQETLLTSSVCVYEVLAGEVFRPGGTDIHQRRQDFGRVEALDFNERIAVEAARLQTELLDDGESLAPRDMMIAATARSTGDEFVVADSDFQTDVLADYLTVTNLRE